MDNSLLALCDALKKVIHQLKPQHHALSFILLIGKHQQGKSSLLRQSQFAHIAVTAEQNSDIYYNQQGIIVELSETWLKQSNNLLQYTLKQLNRCHRLVKISGLLLCVDLRELFITDPQLLTTQMKAHVQLLGRFGTSLGYCTDMAIIFTKLDLLAGFCDFYQYEHASELQKPLGFSLHDSTPHHKLTDVFKTQFEQFIEALGQQVIHKIHPARSSIKRTLIREFPLQLASLRAAIQCLISGIAPRLFRLQALFFTSAEQGGLSLDRLNKKIESEYALTIQDQFPQSHNYRAYFIEGALQAFQAQTQRYSPPITLPYKWLMGAGSGIALLCIVWIAQQYFSTTTLLDQASKELIAYDTLANQQHKTATATYHLAKASTALAKIKSSQLSLPTIQQLKSQLKNNATRQLNQQFLPTLLQDIERAIADAHQSQVARYQALKIYLMLGDAKHFSETAVLAWFQQHWEKMADEPSIIARKMALLKQIIHAPFKPIKLNNQVIVDARNYLNALPASYLFYSLAKIDFPTTTQTMAIDGFATKQLSIPFYLTKAGFQQLLLQMPKITARLQAENWILARQDLHELPLLLQQAYCYEYVIWWQNFMRQIKPAPARDYHQTHDLLVTLRQANTINKLITFMQQQTGPEQGPNATLFNRDIASKFTELSLMSASAVRHLMLTLRELEQFLNTLAVVNDQGKTAFNLTKSRFQGDELANPLTALYSHSHQLPEPVATWAKQIADDTWFSLINDSRTYINHQWQQLVYHDYQTTIANRFPFDIGQNQEIPVADFDRFFAPHGSLNRFIDDYLKPFLDTSKAQWQLKQADNYVLPISSDMINELIRANVITNMFFPEQSEHSQIEFSLQKLSLDPIVANLRLTIGDTKLIDTQASDSYTQFHWPETNARLVLNSIEGNHFELEELGAWAFFRLLQKVNVLVDEQDSANLEILFEINGNSGRYLLKTQNQVNPFIPGILNGFSLMESIV